MPLHRKNPFIVFGYGSICGDFMREALESALECEVSPYCSQLVGLDEVKTAPLCILLVVEMENEPTASLEAYVLCRQAFKDTPIVWVTSDRNDPCEWMFAQENVSRFDTGDGDVVEEALFREPRPGITPPLIAKRGSQLSLTRRLADHIRRVIKR